MLPLLQNRLSLQDILALLRRRPIPLCLLRRDLPIIFAFEDIGCILLLICLLDVLNGDLFWTKDAFGRIWVSLAWGGCDARHFDLVRCFGMWFGCSRAILVIVLFVQRIGNFEQVTIFWCSLVSWSTAPCKPILCRLLLGR